MSTPAMRVCVYTVLLNNYEELNQQPVTSTSAVDFICFTDDPELTSDSWSLRRVRPLFPADAARSQRYLKICAHRALAEYDVSLYIDNSVMLRRSPEDLVRELLPDECSLAMFEHSFRETLSDEFDEVARLGLDARRVCEEQVQHYRSVDPASLALRPLWTGILLRRHGDPGVAEAMETWYAHVLRYSHRDQLSIWFALRSTGITPRIHRLDLHESPFHRWPITVGRDRTRTGISAARSLEQELDRVEQERRRLDDELRKLRSTRSWRWTGPLRSLRRGV